MVEMGCGKYSNKYWTMWKKEKREHPSFSNKQINQIVQDHLDRR
jgi:hypothetical protein